MANPIQGYFDSTSFTLDVNGFPIWNRAVGSTFMAKFAHTVLGNGAASVTTGGFQVVKKTGMTVTVKPYFICKDGYMMYQTGETDITFTSSTSEQVFYIGARLDVANNHFTGDNIAGYTTFVSATDIAACRLTITANAVTITDGMITDLRYNTAYCGQIDEYRERSLELIAELEAALEAALAGGIPAHASTHASGGPDAITPTSIGAASLSNGIVSQSQSRSVLVEKIASFTLAAGDMETILLCNSSSAIVVSIPLDSAYNFPVGTTFNFIRWGSGALSVTKDASANWIVVGNVTTVSAGAAATLIKVSANAWWLVCG